MDCSTPGSSVLHYLPEFAETHVHWVGDTIQPSHPLLSPSPLLLPQSFPGSGSFIVSWLFTSGDQSIGASALAPVLPMSIQGWFPLGLTVWSSRCPRDSQESSPAPQFETISSLALSLLYGSTLTSLYDYWKNYGFDYTCIIYNMYYTTSNPQTVFLKYFIYLFGWAGLSCGMGI